MEILGLIMSPPSNDKICTTWRHHNQGLDSSIHCPQRMKSSSTSNQINPPTPFFWALQSRPSPRSNPYPVPTWLLLLPQKSQRQRPTLLQEKRSCGLTLVRFVQPESLSRGPSQTSGLLRSGLGLPRLLPFTYTKKMRKMLL